MVFTEHLSLKARMYNVYLAVASIEDTPQTGLQWLWWLWILYSHSLHIFCCSCPLQEPQTTHVSFYRKFICCFKHPEVKVSWLDPLAMAVTWKPRLVSHAMLQVQAPRSRDVAEDSQSVAVDPGASSTWKAHVKAVKKFESHFFQNIGPLIDSYICKKFGIPRSPTGPTFCGKYKCILSIRTSQNPPGVQRPRRLDRCHGPWPAVATDLRTWQEKIIKLGSTLYT